MNERYDPHNYYFRVASVGIRTVRTTNLRSTRAAITVRNTTGRTMNILASMLGSILNVQSY
ncbi:MAG: hypothetical protein ABI481_01925 [Pyrinomonadaceae bacterium]